jgi:transcriptional regulator with XRE-family HTH domain
MSTVDSAEYQTMVDRLREAREAAGLTQDEVADELGRLQSFVSKVETGDRRIDPIELCRFAELYEKSVTWFLNPKCA